MVTMKIWHAGAGALLPCESGSAAMARGMVSALRGGSHAAEAGAGMKVGSAKTVHGCQGLEAGTRGPEGGAAHSKLDGIKNG
jgi:hypothetical protein